MPTRYSLALTFAAIAFSAATAAAQQAPCDQGVIKLPSNLNAPFELCSALSTQAPALASQLADITKTLGAEKAELDEIRRLIKTLNGVSQNIGAQRQAELLRNLSSQLAVSQQGGKAKTEEEISTLADGFDGVEDKLVGMLTDKTTADKTTAAVNGPVGDAIAKLDFSSAEAQLDDIRQQLKAIHAEVGEVKQTTKETNQRTKDIQQTVEQTRADEQQFLKMNAEQNQQAMEQAKKIREEQQSNPDLFLNARLFAMQQYVRGANRSTSAAGWTIQTILTSPSHFTDSLQNADLVIVFQAAGKQPWKVSFPRVPVFTSTQNLSQPAAELGDQAIVCFTADDPRGGQRLRWRQSFTLQANSATQFGGRAPGMMNFVAAAPATLSPAKDDACH